MLWTLRHYYGRQFFCAIFFFWTLVLVILEVNCKAKLCGLRKTRYAPLEKIIKNVKMQMSREKQKVGSNSHECKSLGSKINSNL